MLPEGIFLSEIGEEQKDALEAFLSGLKAPFRWFETQNFLKDLSGRDRVLELRRG